MRFLPQLLGLTLQVTIIMKRPIRSGRCDICGANCECNLPAVMTVAKSIASPIPHKMYRNGGGTNAEIIHTIAPHRKPMLYLRIRGVADVKDLLIPVRTYLYDKNYTNGRHMIEQNQQNHSLRHQTQIQPWQAAPTICKSPKILCPK